MVVNLRSKRLTALFSEVWNNLPKKDRDSISGRALLVTDNPLFLPDNQKRVWGAVICVKFRKSIAILYLSPRRLPRQSDSFVRYAIAYRLAHILRGHHEQLFLSPLSEATEKRFEKEADRQVKRWGIPKRKPKQAR